MSAPVPRLSVIIPFKNMAGTISAQLDALVVGLTMAFLLHHAYLLAMAAVTPVLLVVGALGEHTGGHRRTLRSASFADDADDSHDARAGGPAARSDREARAALDAQQAARRGYDSA